MFAARSHLRGAPFVFCGLDPTLKKSQTLTSGVVESYTDSARTDVLDDDLRLSITYAHGKQPRDAAREDQPGTSYLLSVSGDTSLCARSPK